MKKLKSQIYSLAKKLGLTSEFLFLLFKIRNLFGIQTKEDKRLIQFYKILLGSDVQLIFDIGANVGIRTSVFSNLSKKVVAVEPNNDLTRILKSKKYINQVQIIEKACANEISEKEFFLGDNHLVSTLSRRFIEHKKETGAKNIWSQKIKIHTTTLDELILEYGTPDFCKIDVEGFEKEVLSGLSQKIGMISFEFNYPAFEQETLFCIKKLEELGYSEFNFSIGESLVLNFENWIQFDQIYHYLSLHNFPFKNCYGDIYAR